MAGSPLLRSGRAIPRRLPPSRSLVPSRAPPARVDAQVATALEELEAKVRTHEQTVYVLTEYIEAKGAESLFEPIADE